MQRALADLLGAGWPIQQAQAMPGQQGHWSTTTEAVAKWFGLAKKKRY